jgi:hypothetical protein
MKKFEEYISKGKVKKVNPDLSRAKSIIEEAQKREKFISLLNKNVPLTDDTANYFVENIYDTLIELIRAKMFQDGYKAIGHGAHEIEIFYMEKLNCPEKEIFFMNTMRENRNGIKYYGKIHDADYAKISLDFLEKLYVKLLEMTK